MGVRRGLKQDQSGNFSKNCNKMQKEFFYIIDPCLEFLGKIFHTPPRPPPPLGFEPVCMHVPEDCAKSNQESWWSLTIGPHCFHIFLSQFPTQIWFTLKRDFRSCTNNLIACFSFRFSFWKLDLMQIANLSLVKNLGRRRIRAKVNF